MSIFGASPHALREISLLHQLGEHPAVVALLDSFSEPGLIYMVFEHCDRDLAQHLCEMGQLPQAHVSRYAFQLLSGLKHCHAKCIAHRDIKPQNLLLQLKLDQLKLCDFSLSRLVAVGREKQTQKVASLWYRSPEVILGAESKGWALDMWSAACVIWEMATGKVCFPASCEIGMLFRHFELLGTPNEVSWPGVRALPHWSDVFPNFASKELSVGDAALSNLLALMLRCNPLERPPAGVLLGHPCFLFLDKTPPTTTSSTAHRPRDDPRRASCSGSATWQPHWPRPKVETTSIHVEDASPNRCEKEEMSFSRFFGEPSSPKRPKLEEKSMDGQKASLGDAWSLHRKPRSMLW